MAQIDRIYADLVMRVFAHGFVYLDKSRADIEMLQITDHQMVIPMDEFPLITTKQVNWKAVAAELTWMLSGSEYIDYLHEHGVHIWDQDAKNFSDGTHVGLIYGPQWRHWDGDRVDQIQDLLTSLLADPFGRKHMVTAWNPSDLDKMALPPCHWAFEILVYLDQAGHTCFKLKWHQRSVDVFLGLPFDIASYAFLGKLIEALTGYAFTELIGDLSNVHIYKPHIPLLEEQMSRDRGLRAPDFRFKSLTTGLFCEPDNFIIENYAHHPRIKGKMYAKVL